MHNKLHTVGCKLDFTWDVYGAYIYLILFCYVILHVFWGWTCLKIYIGLIGDGCCIVWDAYIIWDVICLCGICMGTNYGI